MDKKDNYLCEFTEPVKGYSSFFAIIPYQNLEVVRYQRKPSKAHVQNLKKSIDKFGFVVPLCVAKNPAEDKFIILDGQHRYISCVELGISQIPCVVIPWERAVYMMSLNVEKQPSIREKSYVALRVYQELNQTSPQIPETDSRVTDAVEEIFYVTLGIVYDMQDKFSGSAWETIMKKADYPLDKTLKEGYKERERRASILFRLDGAIREIIGKIKKMRVGVHPFMYKEIVSYVNPLKRKKGFVDFDELFSKIEKEIDKLKEDPSKFLGASTFVSSSEEEF